MKRAFTTDAVGRLSSAMIPSNSRSALNFGDRIATSRPLDLGYAAQIKEGEHGTVIFTCASTGLVEILMDLQHRGLTPWNNCMWLEPYGTEDIVDGIVLHFCAPDGEAHELYTVAADTIRAVA